MKKYLNDNNRWFYFVLTFLTSWPVLVLGKAFLPEKHEFSCCFSPDGKEFYFTSMNPLVHQNNAGITTDKMKNSIDY
jgi:hypothetical protein